MIQENQHIPCLKLIEIVILVFYIIPFGRILFGIISALHSNVKKFLIRAKAMDVQVSHNDTTMQNKTIASPPFLTKKTKTKQKTKQEHA